MKVDGAFLPSQVPYWNITKEQYRINCKKVSLHYHMLAEGDVVIDLGAGLGEEAIVYAALVGEKGKVYCVEPYPPAFKVLQQVVLLNGLKQVELLPYALYHTAARISLSEDQASYNVVHIADNHNTGNVEAIRFDALMQRIQEPVIGFMKVNIEGGEQYLLDPAFLPFFRRIKHMAIACHDFRFRHEGNPFFQTKEKLCDFFNHHGFEVRSQHTGEAYIDDWVYIFNPRL